MNTTFRTGKKSCAGRADLLDCLRVLGPKGLIETAQLFGYDKIKRLPKAKPVESRPSSALSSSQSSTRKQIVFAEDIPAASFWQAISAIFRSETESGASLWMQQQSTFDPEAEDSRPCLPPPRRLPLASWSRLWPFLRGALGVSADGSIPDWNRVVEYIARKGLMPKRLICLPRRRWAGQGQLLLDYSERLALFWSDINKLRRQLKKMRGRTGLEVCVFEDGPASKCRSAPADDILRPYRMPQPGTPVLAVGDLGCLDKSGKALESWLRLGRRLRRWGCIPTALVLAPPRMWSAGLAKIWRLASWDRGERFPCLDSSAAGGNRPRRKQDQASGLSSLLNLLSAAVFIDSGLLRAIRLLLPRRLVDVGSEAEVWQHEHTHTGLEGFYFDTAQLSLFRRRFQKQDEGLQKKAAELIRAHYGRFAEPVQQEVEACLAELLGDKAAAAASDVYFRSVAKTLFKTGHAGMRGWALQFAGRQHREMWQKSEALPVLWALAHRGLKKKALQPPAGLDVSKVAWVLDPEMKVHQWQFVQLGMELVLDESHGMAGGGSPLAGLAASRSVLSVMDQETGSVKIYRPDKAGGLTAFCLPAGGVISLHTDLQKLKLKTIKKPAWAEAIGRDWRGLFVDIFEGEKTRRLYWKNPDRHPLAGGGVLELAVGFWLDASLFNAWSDFLQRPEWASDFGVDQYGLFAEFVCSSVRQRLRWIPPGRFLMGSPKSEAERYDEDETQHEVILTKGFWLADTATTQELWQAVMGNNPSHFKGKERPVEDVSWNDCRQFLDKINRALPGLELRLPTEAQWEYACRAGSTTPFWFGNNITPEQVNYDGNYPYPGGKKGKYREETVGVRELPCNGWGLYQMHGNVWEWCTDCYGDYPKEFVIDPEGPAKGDLRVLRGGGWFFVGRYVRSAYRIQYLPSYRSHDIGFRLARGQ